MYKITVAGKTMVGNNEDSWRRDPRIWFEQSSAGKAGVAYVGYAGKSGPDGAVNEYGLAYDAFTMPHKPGMPGRDPGKKDFSYSQLKTIMQTCKTVDDVNAILSEQNLHVLNGSPLFNGGMLLFADSTGKYLVVEAGKLTFGNDEKFLLANFSIADTKDLSTIKMERYCKGVDFLRNKPLSTDVAFCTALSDTMSVNRKKAGDGTLYTTIYDLKDGIIYAYFFHDYNQRVTFNLKEELAKGDHAYSFTDLFPSNYNFSRFLSFMTPQNNKLIFMFLIACSLIFAFTFVFFLFSFFKSPKSEPRRYLKLILSFTGLAFCYYSYVLLRNQGIYYFPAPFLDGYSVMVSISSYLPLLLILSIIPLVLALIRIIRKKQWSRFARIIFVVNTFVFIILLGLFAYWQLFDIFG
ncbi:MAG TPA: hypothetical protein PLP88_01825 [Bacteroidales bacterium]|nr:hypothetical protein [Bacteroidales bacterium]